MCLLAFFVTSADKSQLFMLFTNILPEAVFCSGTLNVYVVLLMLLVPLFLCTIDCYDTRGSKRKGNNLAIPPWAIALILILLLLLLGLLALALLKLLLMLLVCYGVI